MFLSAFRWQQRKWTDIFFRADRRTSTIFINSNHRYIWWYEAVSDDNFDIAISFYCDNNWKWQSYSRAIGNDLSK